MGRLLHGDAHAPGDAAAGPLSADSGQKVLPPRPGTQATRTPAQLHVNFTESMCANGENKWPNSSQSAAGHAVTPVPGCHPRNPALCHNHQLWGFDKGHGHRGAEGMVWSPWNRKDSETLRAGRTEAGKASGVCVTWSPVQCAGAVAITGEAGGHRQLTEQRDIRTAADDVLCL